MTCIDEELKFNLTMNGCVDSCGEYDGRGECMTYYTEGNVIMSTCNCKAGNYILNVMLIIIQTVVNTFTSRTRDKADVSALRITRVRFEFTINITNLLWIYQYHEFAIHWLIFEFSTWKLYVEPSKLKQFKIPCRKNALVQIRINVWTVYSINLFNILISNVPTLSYPIY